MLSVFAYGRYMYMYVAYYLYVYIHMSEYRCIHVCVLCMTAWFSVPLFPFYPQLCWCLSGRSVCLHAYPSVCLQCLYGCLYSCLCAKLSVCLSACMHA